MILPKILEREATLLVGLRIKTSLITLDTERLWKSFMPRHKEVKSRVEGVYYSVQCYPDDTDFESFTPTTEFDKWAAVEVDVLHDIPSGMESLEIPSGLYAVFTHTGLSSDFHKTLNNIFGQWLPKSDYLFDNRPQFEVMGDKYLGPENENSEELIFIPIKPRQ